MIVEGKQARIVQKLLSLVEKTVRAVRMYPSGHGSIDTFLDATAEQFQRALSGGSPLRLEVGEDRLSVDDETVYRIADHSESLAFLLYKDGVRAITFYPGIDRSEILDLAKGFVLDISAQSIEDDMVTYIWERDLRHISLSVVDDYLSSYLPDELRGNEAIAEKVREKVGPAGYDAKDLKEKILTVPLEGSRLSSIPIKRALLTPEMLPPTRGELEHLQHLLGDDRWESDFRDLLSLLFLILSQETDRESRSSYLLLFRQILLESLQNGPLRHAIDLYASLRALARKAPSAPSPHYVSVEHVLDTLFTAEMADELGESIEKGRLQDIESLPEFVRLLPPNAIPSLTGLLEKVSSRKGRRVLCQALAGIAAGNLSYFMSGIETRPWFVARNVAFILGLAGSEIVVPSLATLLNHEEPKVRREALRALSQCEGKEAVDLLLRSLADDEPGTRLQAIIGLPGRRDRELAQRLLAVTGSKDFALRPMAEKEALYRKLGNVSPPDMISSLAKSVAGKKWFQGRRLKDQLYLVVTAFASHNSMEARDFLGSLQNISEERTAAVVSECLAKPAKTVKRKDYGD